MYIQKKKSLSPISVVILSIMVSFLIVFSYFTNFVKVLNLDFKEPYKAETIRVVGVIVPPLGAIMGFMDIEDK